MNNEEDITINYYNNNAQKFNADTVDANLNEVYKSFLNILNSKAYILDFGCGSGRDAKYFLECGFKVDAIDGSIEMCKIASDYTGINVRSMYFEELDEIDKYDGIWACSSILHLPYDGLKQIMMKIFTALKEKGILYTSFKYGEYEGIRNGRYFTDMNEKKINELLSELKLFEVVELKVTSDVRPERANEKWLNVILRKKTS